MITIRLYGLLALEYGKRFDLAIDTAAEGVRALCCQFDGLQRQMAEGGYYVRIARRAVTADNAGERLHDRLHDGDVIHIVPEMAGGGKFGQIILGAVLIVGALWTGGWSLSGLTALGSATFAGGVSLVLGGIAQMLVKPPSYDLAQSSNTSRSSAFTNLDNISPQGAHVPVAYGYLEVGSVVVSQSIESYDLGDEAAKPSGVVSYRREYHAPVPVDAQHLPDATVDDVRARNYKLVVA